VTLISLTCLPQLNASLINNDKFCFKDLVLLNLILNQFKRDHAH